MPDSRFDGSLFDESLFDERPQFGSDTRNASVAAATPMRHRVASAVLANASAAAAAILRVRAAVAALVNRSLAWAELPLAAPQTTGLLFTGWSRPMPGASLRAQPWARMTPGAGVNLRTSQWVGPMA